MGDEHLDTTLSIKNLVLIPSEFEGISNDTSDVPTCDNNHINVEIDLVESLINRDTSIVYSSKIDPILEEFAGELAHIAPIPPGIVKADFDPNDDTITFLFRARYDHTEETRSGSTTTHANYSLPEYESFHFDNPSFPRPPPEPPDVEICLHCEPDVSMIDNFNELNDDQRGSEIDFYEDDDSFTFV
ncbi:hypothetical protein Tco_0112577, partial [Tanacetum coccineum]